MNLETVHINLPEAAADVAKRRLLSVHGDPFVSVDWECVVFMHFAVPPDFLLRQFAGPFELELHEGRGIVTLVALTMRDFRPARLGVAYLMRPLREQRFLNLRTYVRHHDEPGALFLWGWRSRPFGLPLPGGFGLPFSFAASSYQHDSQSGTLRGRVTDERGSLTYHAPIDPELAPTACAPESVGAFALQRYTGYFNRSRKASVFRAWHPSWQQIPIEVTFTDISLVTSKFPWFSEARLVGANYAPGFKGVWLGEAHRLDVATGRDRKHHRLSAFYEMP